MDSLMVIEQAEVTVEPGATAQVTVRLMNPGSIVEGYNLELVGAPAAWARVHRRPSATTGTRRSAIPAYTGTAARR